MKSLQLFPVALAGLGMENTIGTTGETSSPLHLKLQGLEKILSQRIRGQAHVMARHQGPHRAKTRARREAAGLDRLAVVVRQLLVERCGFHT